MATRARSPLFLVTGPSGAGKSTVSRELAARFERGVHVEGDLFRRMIVSGGADMTPRPATDALEQLALRFDSRPQRRTRSWPLASALCWKTS